MRELEKYASRWAKMMVEIDSCMDALVMLFNWYIKLAGCDTAWIVPQMHIFTCIVDYYSVLAPK